MPRYFSGGCRKLEKPPKCERSRLQPRRWLARPYHRLAAATLWLSIVTIPEYIAVTMGTRIVLAFHHTKAEAESAMASIEAKTM